MMRDPAHPGILIRDELLKRLDLELSEAAALLDVPDRELADLLNAHAPLIAEMAIRIEIVFGPNADHLMRMQLAYDMANAREKADQLDISKYEPDTENA